jgi:hypothetical protein
MREKHGLQLGRRDLHAFVLDQLFHAIHDEEAPALVR